MKNKRVAMAVLLACLIFVLAPGLVIAAQADMETGEECVLLTWTPHSVCEWPAGRYLQYGVGSVMLAGELMPPDDSLMGATARISGSLAINGSCTILVVEELDICIPPPEPETLDSTK